MKTLQRIRNWAVSHPNTMTYIAIVSTVNFFLSIYLAVSGH